MANGVQIIRGTAALPSDFEQQFVRVHGREMSLEERKFFGVHSEELRGKQDAAELKRGLKVA
jgi:hypothetical protein